MSRGNWFLGVCTETTMELDAGLWSALPAELLERVLTLLPVPALCRFRTVSKRWNMLMSMPEFANLCVGNASTDNWYIVGLWKHEIRRGGAVYAKISRSKYRWWGIFDCNARCWYKVKSQEYPKGYTGNAWSLAVDGGLVCKLYQSSITGSVTLSISNLLGSSSRQLPDPPLLSTGGRFDRSGHLRFVVDDNSKSFKIFLINTVVFVRNPGVSNLLVRVYESATNQWRSLPNPLLQTKIGNHQMAMLHGVLYVLLQSSDCRKNWLFRHNLVDDAWEDTDVRITIPPEFCQQVINDLVVIKGLVVSDNRLFMVTYSDVFCNRRNDGTSWPLVISEILLQEKACKTEFQITEASPLHQNLLRLQTVRNVDPDDPCVVMVFWMKVLGFGKYIMVMSTETGKSMVYNVVTRMWDFLPEDHSGTRFDHGTPMNHLRLPSCTDW